MLRVVKVLSVFVAVNARNMNETTTMRNSSCEGCPKATALFYYKCCSKDECCLYLQSWLLMILMGLMSFAAICSLLHFIKFILHCRRSSTVSDY
ncbi:unnamed protein product [Bursaphelenchus xylophilus]|uniref:(pine wood nematode) hypothetical protein n=1 Tax=Bursaphelenchus xylophilus TaxID=6326 RepID=A0A1I7SAW6_BURXY|nr:unnamed protein product [Bursaphelenchus xylophilus]CAG9106146.1 unnamed protein product [Bursaphelenchus xylophilus]